MHASRERVVLRLSEPTLMSDLGTHLRDVGFLVLVLVGDGGQIEAHLLNQVSDRFEHERLGETLVAWRRKHPQVSVDEVG